LKTEPRIKVENKFLPDYTHAKMAGRKRKRYKIEPRISVAYPLCWNWNIKAKSLKNY